MSARGIVHVHSSYSYDSTTPLAEIAALARREGLRFVVQTEHSNELTAAAHAEYRRETADLSGPDLLVVPAVEYASSDNAVHVLAVGIDEYFDDLARFDLSRLDDLLERLARRGGASILAHPERAHAIDKIPAGTLSRFDGIEVWNGKTDRWGPSPRALTALAASRSARPAFATAGLDQHRLSDYRRVGLELPEAPCDAASLVALLRARRFEIFFGRLRWDPHRAGAGSRALARSSRWLLRRARYLKAKARAAVARGGR
ncbi:MAG TPA: hypothetical protein VFV19_03435 [Candidatus Polarisedimenticolaceae bacterium]|nr:hypothetical protein [Candidatus Polarisedimenticolaceae bacterium]